MNHRNAIQFARENLARLEQRKEQAEALAAANPTDVNLRERLLAGARVQGARQHLDQLLQEQGQ